MTEIIENAEVIIENDQKPKVKPKQAKTVETQEMDLINVVDEKLFLPMTAEFYTCYGNSLNYEKIYVRTSRDDARKSIFLLPEGSTLFELNIKHDSVVNFEEDINLRLTKKVRVSLIRSEDGMAYVLVENGARAPFKIFEDTSLGIITKRGPK